MVKITSPKNLFIRLSTFILSAHFVYGGNENAKRLFDDLLTHYNKLKRPATLPTETTVVGLRLKLSQIIDVHEKNQIMTTIVWLKQQWHDPKLRWQPSRYGNISVLYVPAEMIWTPDIVLYNKPWRFYTTVYMPTNMPPRSAEGDYNITICTKATLHHTGLVVWEPPAIFHSMCMIDVEWFPFDVQKCHLQFGSWCHSQSLSYDESLVELVHLETTETRTRQEIDLSTGKLQNITEVVDGIDLSDYYPSVEWDIMDRPARRRRVFYTYGSAVFNKMFVDIVYTLELRRKPLFYTVNLVFPCAGISFCTVLVFYLPAGSGEKIGLSISILVSLTVFFLLLIEIVPATSIVLPLIGKYLLFTMIMVTLSVLITVVALNLHFRNPNTHRMPGWIKKLFLRTLPKYLFIRRPLETDEISFRRAFMGKYAINYHTNALGESGNRPQKPRPSETQIDPTVSERRRKIAELYYSPQALKAFENVCFIAELLKKKDKDDKIDEDWRFVAMVFDRLCLWIFSMLCVFGTAFILLRAPTLRSDREPIDLLQPPGSAAEGLLPGRGVGP